MRLEVWKANSETEINAAFETLVRESGIPQMNRGRRPTMPVSAHYEARSARMAAVVQPRRRRTHRRRTRIGTDETIDWNRRIVGPVGQADAFAQVPDRRW